MNNNLNKLVYRNFDLQSLRKEFKKYCPDYMDKIFADFPSRAINLYDMVICKYIPAYHNNLLKDDWKAEIQINDLLSTTDDFHLILICKNKSIITQNDKFYKMILNLEEANLLAMDTFFKIVDCLSETDPFHLTLTPICNNYFTSSGIHEITKELTLTFKLQFNKFKVLKMIEASCQPGGQNLRESKMAIALVVAYIHSTLLEYTDDFYKITILQIIDYYHKALKKFDYEMFNVIAKFSRYHVQLSFIKGSNVKQIVQEVLNRSDKGAGLSTNYILRFNSP